MLTKPKNIKAKKNYKETREPHAYNPIYQKPYNYFGCQFCTSKTGRKKRFKNLFCLYHHYTREHPRENFKELTMGIADLIIKGILF